MSLHFQAPLNVMYITLIISDGLFPDIVPGIEHSALMPLMLLRLARMAIFFDKISERLVGSPQSAQGGPHLVTEQVFPFDVQ